MRLFLVLFALIVLCGCTVGCCGKQMGFRSPFSFNDAAPEVVPIQWGLVQQVKPAIVAVPPPAGITFGGDGCVPAGTVAPGGTFTPVFQQPAGK